MSEEEIRKIAKEYAEMYFTKGIDSTKIFNYVDELEKKVEQLENENFNIRENIHLERISLPPELTKDKDFMGLYDIPSYEDLQQKAEQLEKELQITANKCKQLENIRKEAIEYLDKKLKLLPHYMYEVEMYDLLNILNKGGASND